MKLRWSLLTTVVLTTSTLARAQDVPWDEIGVTEHLGGQVSLDGHFRGEDGKEQRLDAFTDGKPTVLTLVYYDCTTLCPEVLEGLARAVKAMTLEPGEDFELVTVSFDPGEGMNRAVETRNEYASRQKGWRFLTGERSSIDRLTHEVGFRYVGDAAKTQFAHPAVVVVLTPDGVVSRYFYGLEIAPRDLELALVEASRGKIGTTVDHVLLYCCHYDPTTGKYGLVISKVIQLAGIVTILAIGGLIGVLSLVRGR